MVNEDSQPPLPSLSWRVGSTLVMGAVGSFFRLVLGANTVDVHGLDRFMDMLDRREDVSRRKRGLITGEPEHFCFRSP